ncbi:MAG: contractile injection system tape measure protein [Cyanobacteria bacterium P01_G01_bin.54]
MTSQRHIIKRQILDLQVSSEMGALTLQNRVSAIYRSKLVPLIEAYCDRLSSPEQIHRIDRLDIDLGEIEIENLEADLVQKVEAALAQELTHPTATATTEADSPAATPVAALDTSDRGKSRSRELILSPQAQPISALEANLELLNVFLQAGRLPWWSKPLTPQQLEEKFLQLLQTAPQPASTLLQTALQSVQGRQRILYQFSKSVWQALLQCLSPPWSAAVATYHQELQGLMPHIPALQTWTPERLQKCLWQGILLQLSLELPPRFSAARVLTSNLLHLATQAQIEPAALVTQLRQASAMLPKTKQNLLPQVLEKWPTDPAVSDSTAIAKGSAQSAIADNESITETDSVAPPTPMQVNTAVVSQDGETAAIASDTAQSAIVDRQISSRASSESKPTDGVERVVVERADAASDCQTSPPLDPHSVPSATDVPEDNSLSPPNLSSPSTSSTEADDFLPTTPFAIEPKSENKTERISPAVEHSISSPVADPVTKGAAPLPLSSSPLQSPPTSATPYFPPESDTDIYIQNAGLVLLWPFLNRWLTTLGLVEANQFLTLSASQRGILLLQYLVDASLASSEAQLPLNKLLCGANLEDSLPTTLDILESEQQESEALLMAVIHHWSALGNVSSHALRHSFLQRNGLLTFTTDHYLLQVEQQTHDILLERLPWTIKTVKLPWMERVLQVEWG